MTPDIDYISASNGSGEAVRATVTALRLTGATTLSVDDVTNWPDKFIAAYGTLNVSTGLIDSTTLRVFYGHLDGGAIEIDDFAPGNSDNGNSVDDIVVLKPTTAWSDMLHDVLSVSLDTDGTLLDSVVSEVATETLNTGKKATNLRVKPRSVSTTTTATLTPNISNYNVYDVTAQAGALTIANPLGTPDNGDVIIFRIKDDGTSRAITYGNAYVNISGLDSLTATAVGKWHTVGAMYNSDASKWHVVSISTEA